MSVYLPIGREDGGRDSSKRFNTRRPKLNQDILRYVQRHGRHPDRGAERNEAYKEN